MAMGLFLVYDIQVRSALYLLLLLLFAIKLDGCIYSPVRCYDAGYSTGQPEPHISGILMQLPAYSRRFETSSQ